jgi:hypothetical protein
LNEFGGFDTQVYLQMDLGRHYENQNLGNCYLLKPEENLALEIIALILERQKHLNLEMIVAETRLHSDIRDRVV